MTCRDVQQHLLASTELSSAELAHVSACSECRQFELGLNENRALLAPIASTVPSLGLAAAAVARHTAVPAPRSSRAWGWFALAPVAAALAVALWPHTPSKRDVSQGPAPVRAREGEAPAEPQTPRAGSRLRFTDARPRTGYADGSAGASPSHRVPQPVALVSEEAYLDGRRLSSAVWLASSSRERAAWASALEKLPIPQEDFVRIPLPRLASTDGKAAGDAIRKYEEQAKVVDVRLGKRVTLQLKAVSLEEFAAEVTRQSGVSIQASRGIADEKVTVFVKETPLRDVIREVARLFGYYWGRIGEEGKYRYTLEQDLRSQLAEEEMRNRDEHAALLDLDDKMAQLQPLLNLSPKEVRARWSGATDEEKKRLRPLLDGSWGGSQLYHRLSAGERIALATGKELTYGNLPGASGQPLPGEVADPLRKEYWSTVRTGPVDGGDGTIPVDSPNLYQGAKLKISRSELGQLTLSSSSIVTWLGGDGHQRGGLGTMDTLAVGQSPSTAKPENARNNAALKKDPAFQKEVSFKPEPSCPRLKAEAGKKASGTPHAASFGAGGEYRRAMEGVRRANGQKDVPHVTSADVWEEVHNKTGLPIVADSYTRLCDQPAVTVDKATLFDALARVGDELGVRWRKDGAFLLARSTAYFWNKRKEVPNRLLERWRKDREEAGLPFEDLLQIAQLSDEQLSSKMVADAVSHCWGIDEWRITEPVMDRSDAPWLRFLAANPAVAQAALKPEGVEFEALGQRTQQEFFQLLSRDGPYAPIDYQHSRLRVEYVPSGWYVMLSPRLAPHTRGEAPPSALAPRQPTQLVAERTFEAALAAARKIDPGVAPTQIARSEGIFALRVIPPTGSSMRVAGESPLD